MQICIECLLYLPCSVDTILSNNDLVSTLLELTVLQEILTLDKSWKYVKFCERKAHYKGT